MGYLEQKKIITKKYLEEPILLKNFIEQDTIDEWNLRLQIPDSGQYEISSLERDGRIDGPFYFQKFTIEENKHKKIIQWFRHKFSDYIDFNKHSLHMIHLIIARTPRNVIHVDFYDGWTETNGFKEELLGKSVIVPIAINENRSISDKCLESSKCKTIIFQQYYLGNGRYLAKDKLENIDPFDILSYDQKFFVNYKANQTINPDFHQEQIDNIPAQFFDGLSYHSEYEWQLGSAAIWNRCQLHCPNNFTKFGIKEKAYALFLTKNKETQDINRIF